MSWQRDLEDVADYIRQVEDERDELADKVVELEDQLEKYGHEQS